MITNTKIGYGGRLGNQMFQYAMLLGVSAKTGFQIKIPRKNATVVKEDGCLDLYTGKWISYRFLLQECFNIDIQWCDKLEIKYISNESYFHFDQSIFGTRYAPLVDGTDFNGYYQSYKYFEHIMPQIYETFSFKHEIFEKANNAIQEFRKNGNPIVAIHVRRGDYLGIPDILPVCDVDYYTRAFEHFSDKNYNFLICSDDIQWCIDTFGDGENVFYPVDNDSYADLCAMSLCDHNIISNSTFSWWAAMLNRNVNKKVIAPLQWFGPKLASNDTKDLIPNEWIRI